MTPQETELADEQLDAFLTEIGVLSSPLPPEVIEKEPSFDHLLDEIFELTKIPSSPPFTPSLPKLPLEEDNKRRSYSIIWITSALLFSLLVGSSFGFFWGKGQGLRDAPIVEPQEEIIIQISSWIKELTQPLETLEPSTPVKDYSQREEIIEPIEPPTEMEMLAPTEMT